MNFEDWKILRFEKLSSTNDTALEYSATADGCYVIRADEQTAGRGRRGRVWQGLKGNLFFSLLLKFEMEKLGELVIISALSLYQSIKQISPQADVLLKWPTDVLLSGAKVSGILLEKAAGDYMIVGIGVNVEQSPQGKDMLYRATSLKEAGINISGDDFLTLYLRIFSNNINILNAEGFESLRRLWNDNAKAMGREIVVRQEKKDVSGIFKGIDEKANLLLEKNGRTDKITFGDVFYKE